MDVDVDVDDVFGDEQQVNELCFRIWSDKPVTLSQYKEALMRINFRDRPQWISSPLVVAIQKKRLDLVKLMIWELEFNVNATNSTKTRYSGKFPSGSLSTSWKPTQETVQASFYHPECWCPLAAAIEVKSDEILDFLDMTRMVNANITNPNYNSGCRTALQLAVMKGLNRQVMQLIDQMAADVNLTLSLNQDGSHPFTVLHHSMLMEVKEKSENLDLTKILLLRGADVNTSATYSHQCEPGLPGKLGSALDFANQLKQCFPLSIRTVNHLLTLIYLTSRLHLANTKLVQLQYNYEMNMKDLMQQQDSSQTQMMSQHLAEEVQVLSETIKLLGKQLKEKDDTISQLENKNSEVVMKKDLKIMSLEQQCVKANGIERQLKTLKDRAEKETKENNLKIKSLEEQCKKADVIIQQQTNTNDRIERVISEKNKKIRNLTDQLQTALTTLNLQSNSKEKHFLEKDTKMTDLTQQLEMTKLELIKQKEESDHIISEKDIKIKELTEQLNNLKSEIKKRIYEEHPKIRELTQQPELTQMRINHQTNAKKPDEIKTREVTEQIDEKAPSSVSKPMMASNLKRSAEKSLLLLTTGPFQVLSIFKMLEAGETSNIQSLLKEVQQHFNINCRYENPSCPHLVGPLLLFAIEFAHEDIINSLVSDFKANINTEIIWNGKPSTMLIYAIAKSIRDNTFEPIVIQLLFLGVDPFVSGWMEINQKWSFGLPLDLIFYYKNSCVDRQTPEGKDEFISDVIGLLIAKEEEVWNKITPKDVEKEISGYIQWDHSQHEVIAQRIKIFAHRIERANNVSQEIDKLQQSPSYMSFDEMATEAAHTNQNLEASLNIITEIRKIKSDSNYLDEDQLQLLMRSVQDDKTESRNRDLECIICMEMPTSTAGDNNYVFSCHKDHLLCQRCLEKIDMCPVCRQNLQTNPPKRNYLAERMIAQILDTSVIKSRIDNLTANLPEDLAKSLSKIQSAVQETKMTIKNLEMKLVRARQLQEQKKCLLAKSEYLPLYEIELIQKRSNDKIKEAEKLHKKISDLKKSQFYLTEGELENLQDSLAIFKLKFNIIDKI